MFWLLDCISLRFTNKLSYRNCLSPRASYRIEFKIIYRDEFNCLMRVTFLLGSRQIPVWKVEDFLSSGTGGVPREVTVRSSKGVRRHYSEEGPRVAGSAPLPQDPAPRCRSPAAWSWCPCPETGVVSTSYEGSHCVAG
jgi:hypothetical protein